MTDLAPIVSTASPMKDFRVVTIQHVVKDVYGMPYRRPHVVHVSQVDTFVTACIRLHFAPGVNPSNRQETLKIEAIFVDEFVPVGPYWWCMPNLGEIRGELGATLFDPHAPHIAHWSSPAYKARMEAEIQAECDRDP